MLEFGEVEGVDGIGGIAGRSGALEFAEGPPGLGCGGGSGFVARSVADPGFDGGDFGWGERGFAGRHVEIAVAADGLVEEAFRGVAGDDGGPAFAAFAEGFGGAEVEAGGLDLAVALETFRFEDVLSGLGVGVAGEEGEEEPQRGAHAE